MGDCSFMKQDVARTGRLWICIKHGRDRVYCELDELREAVCQYESARWNEHESQGRKYDKLLRLADYYGWEEKAIAEQKKK